jgi:hypothetical protein
VTPRPTPTPTPAPTPTPTPASTPAPTAAANEPPVTPTDAIEVTQHGVGRNVVDRRLVGRADRFRPGARVVFWTVVAGGRRGQGIRHVWLKDGRAVARAELPVGSAQWRTYSRRVLPLDAAGEWVVEARTSDGRLLARDEFLCTTEEPPGDRDGTRPEALPVP